jgi:lipoprotein-releasing system permease protein
VAIAQTLEEVAFFEYKEHQDFGTVKGVDELYTKVTSIDSTIREGVYALQDKDRFYAVAGVGMRNKLAIDVADKFTPLAIYMPKRESVSAFQQPFKKLFAQPVGTFVIQQDFDNQYILTSLEMVRQLLGYKNELTALEIKLSPTADKDEVIEKMEQILGEAYVIKDRYQQDEAFLKLMNIEKWMSFAILSLTLLLVAFNMIGSLWMIVLEKKKDIAILKSMGAQDTTIRNIFLNQGILLCLLGLVLGSALAIGLYVSQKAYGIVPIPAGFVVDAYPISMRFYDFMVVALTVVGIGIVASIPPALRAVKVSAMIKEE